MTDPPTSIEGALAVLERHAIDVDPGGLIHLPSDATQMPAELWSAVDTLCEKWGYDFIIEGVDR